MRSESYNHVLTPGRYVGAADIEDDEVPFAERFSALKEKLDAQFAEAEILSKSILKRLSETIVL